MKKITALFFLLLLFSIVINTTKENKIKTLKVFNEVEEGYNLYLLDLRNSMVFTSDLSRYFNKSDKIIYISPKISPIVNKEMPSNLKKYFFYGSNLENNLRRFNDLYAHSFKLKGQEVENINKIKLDYIKIYANSIKINYLKDNIKQVVIELLSN